MRKVALELSALKSTKPAQYVIRFVFGGLCTALAGLIAKRYGAVVGGLFLAFPAIFPASATLIEDRSKQKMAKIGADGTRRGRLAAAIDARGAALGSLGLCAFAMILWKYLPVNAPTIVIIGAAFGWTLVSSCLWLMVPKTRHFLAKADRKSSR